MGRADLKTVSAPPASAERYRRIAQRVPPETSGEPDWAGIDDLIRHVPLGESAKRRVFDEMNRPGRHYHGVNHIAQLWRRHRRYAAQEGLDDPAIDRLIACSILFHDSVYDPSRQDNEARSAEVWLKASEEAELDEKDRQWVAETIRATRSHLDYVFNARLRSEASRLRERARQWMLDLDLSTLGDTPQAFARNTRQLRAEFAHQSDRQWMEKLRGFYQRLLDAPKIYRSPVLAEKYETQARANLRAAIRRDCSK